jgi:hypothetical protein
MERFVARVLHLTPDDFVDRAEVVFAVAHR